MSNDNSSNKRIAKNTLMLYIRMLVSMAVGLYTSRVVLQTLGVEDYGIFGVVGGVVSMFSFLNSAMSGATSRFLTFEMGKANHEERLRDTFNSALIIHVGIAIFILLIAETVGLWILNNKLVIPANRMSAASVVYQCSIIGMMIGVSQVPYNASIIAHEKMDIYAYVELLHVFLKLGIVYVLLIGDYDKLILYSVLSLGVSIIIAMVYRFYSIRHFSETHIRLVWDKEILHPMLGFTGWTTLSECGYSFRVYGSNIVLNTFFGVIVNAAGGIASTVQGILVGFVGNVTTAFRPQIIKAYSVGDINRMTKLMQFAIRINLFLVSLLVAPFLVETHYLLQLWLGEVPEYSVVFCRCLFLAIFVMGVSQIIVIGIQATGRMKVTSIMRSIMYILTPVFIYLVFRLGCQLPHIGYLIIVGVQALVCLAEVFILARQIPQINSFVIIKDYLLLIVLVVGLSYFVTYYSSGFEESLLKLGICISILWILTACVFFFLILDSNDRQTSLSFIRQLINRWSLKRV